MTREESGLRLRSAKRRMRKKIQHKVTKGSGAYVEGIPLLNDAQLQRSYLPFAADDGEVGSGWDEVPGLVAQVPSPG